MFQGRSERGETSYLGLISVREDVKISSEATDVHDSVVSEEQKKNQLHGGQTKLRDSL